MSWEARDRVLEALKGEAKGAAALAISKKAGLPLIEAVKILEELVAQGLVEKRGKTYRLRGA
jgi:DNA-binding IclR family transcriptional regulator